MPKYVSANEYFIGIKQIQNDIAKLYIEISLVYGRIWNELTFLHSHHGWEGIGFMWKMNFEIFIKSLRFETPWVRKKGFYESVCLSVCRRSCAA